MSLPRHLAALLGVLGRGGLDAAAERTQALMATFASGLDEQEDQQGELLDELHPDTAASSGLLESWEDLLDLVVTEGDDDDTRRARVVAALRRIPDFRPATIEALVEDWTGMDWTLIEPGVFRCDDADSLCDTTDDVVDAGYVFILDGDRDTADGLGIKRAKVEYFVRTIKPAHTRAIVRFSGDFCCDDPLSLTDTDLLGS